MGDKNGNNSDNDWNNEDLEYNTKGQVKCPKCGKWVGIGGRGLSQLTICHIPSKECRKGRTKGFGDLTKMFGMKPKAKITPKPMHAVVEGTSPHPTLNSTKSLLAAILCIPNVPQGENNDYLSCFCQPAETDDDPNLTANELFETRINSQLHNGVSWGNEVPSEQFLGLTRENVYGFIRFVEYWVQRGIGKGVFQARIDTIVDGLVRWRQTEQRGEADPQNRVQPTPPDTLEGPQMSLLDESQPIVIPDSSDDEIEQIPGPTEKPVLSVRPQQPRAIAQACEGYTLPIPAGLSPHSSYPFGLHNVQSLPWDYAIRNGSMVLLSHCCEGDARGTGRVCHACQALVENKWVVGILQWMMHGTREGTVWAYHGVAGLIASLKQKNGQIEFYRLRGLNQARKLLTAASTLSEYKHFLVAVASHKVERVDRIICLGLRHKQGIRAMLAVTLKAASGLYKPKDYQEEDYMRAIVLWKLGGDRIATIAHHAFGAPSVATLRNQLSIPPIIPSPAMPTFIEISTNVMLTFEGLLDALKLRDGVWCVHAVLMFDEITTEKRIHWDPKTNKFLGVCREHGHRISLEFGGEKDMEGLFKALDSGEVHYAGEATIGAIGILSDDNRVYASRVILISGDCKQETGPQHAVLIRKVLEAINSQKKNTNIRIVSIASDGEARRGAALAELTFKKPLSPSSPIYEQLSPLTFMNLMVGDDDITADKDWKHVFKRLRNLLLRASGVVVGGVRITPTIIQAHLKAEGTSPDHIRAILNPNDKQDNPAFVQARESLWILRRFLYHTVVPYICINLSITEQLEHLSAASHLALALYKMEGKHFLPTQLYTDLQLMIKNIFFCVAKAKVDTPEGSFYLIIVGTDRLEETFSDLRMMVGNDANLDCLCYELRSLLRQGVE
ncbi:hypothetical protein FA13DRAFT_1795190 [Coprinellus micaceus]|uniref:Uncharacterized protein n=1 Tax=Coprinellus micaceus TaxID=71717 RepID=A0A4Y7SYK3_COPMI|nr:hypothetical protein FA13DRAFT_1795190 [Coprinellus micaceus]